MTGLVAAKVDRIRELVFKPRKQHMLMAQPGLWVQLATAMYTVEDAELAIEAFENDTAIHDKGSLYLRTYGLLQALFLQQDAVRHLAEAVDLPFDLQGYPGLMEIRDLRNDVVGHPTKRGGQLPSYHAIIRRSMTPDTLQILSTDSAGNTERRRVNLGEVTRSQRGLICNALDGIVETLEREMAEHKQKFRDTKLEAIFLDNWGYCLEKMREGTTHNDRASLVVAQAGCETMRCMLEAFREALRDRGMDVGTYPGVGDTWKELLYPLAALERYFGMESDDGFFPESQTANIFTWYVGKKMAELRAMAREIDLDYEN